MDGSNWESDPVTETYGSFMPNSTVTVYLKQQNQCGTSPESSIKQKMPTTPKGCMEIVTNQVSSLELNENLDTLSGKSKTSGSLNNNTELNKIAVLFQNTPNPFNQITTIGYFLPSNVESASINIYNIQGLKVKSYPIHDRGNGIITIKTGDLSTAGIYLYTLITDGIVIDTKRLILTD